MPRRQGQECRSAGFSGCGCGGLDDFLLMLDGEAIHRADLSCHGQVAAALLVVHHGQVAVHRDGLVGVLLHAQAAGDTADAAYLLDPFARIP